jgi:hypothetical protein
MPPFGALAKNVAAIDMRSKNYLTFFSRSETSVWLVLCASELYKYWSDNSRQKARPMIG